MRISSADDHMGDPVWEVYNLRRNASFNVNYWTRKLRPLERFDFLMERALLAAAVASVVAGLVFWQSSTGGKVVWVVLSSLTTILAAANALSGLANRISKLREIILEYRAVESLLGELSDNIKAAQRYSKAMHDMFKALLGRYDNAEMREPPEPGDEKLRDECYEIVNRELPVDSFYLPPVTDFQHARASGSVGRTR